MAARTCSGVRPNLWGIPKQVRDLGHPPLVAGAWDLQPSATGGTPGAGYPETSQPPYRL
jgi:hypothetical protein